MGSSQVIFAEPAVTLGTLMTAYQTLINSSRGANTPAPVAMSVQPKVTNTAKVSNALGKAFLATSS